MYLTPHEVTLEVSAVAFINVFIVYMAAFSYKLDWRGMVAVIVLASFLTASLNSLFLKNISVTKIDERALMAEGMGILLISVLSSLAVFIVLVSRFNFMMAIGMSLFSGLLLSMLRTLAA
jgi:hypothetical protein